MHDGYRRHRLQIAGETATGDCRAVATLNSATWQAADNLSLMILQRFYSYSYYSLFGQSFADGSRVQNESGIYLGVTWKSLQSCPTLCDPIDESPPGSPVPGILQARTLEWVAISFSNA